MIKGQEYRLKKDIITPEETIPAGAVFDFFSGVGEAIDYDYRIVKELVEDFDEWFEKVEEAYERWRAEKDGEYFTVCHGGLIRTLPDLYTNSDYYNFNTGNYFKTEDEADDYRNYLVARQRLKDSANGFIPKKGERAYYVFYDGEMLLKSWSDEKFIPGVIYFRTFEDADKSTERYKGDWMFVVNYETGRL